MAFNCLSCLSTEFLKLVYIIKTSIWVKILLPVLVFFGPTGPILLFVGFVSLINGYYEYKFLKKNGKKLSTFHVNSLISKITLFMVLILISFSFETLLLKDIFLSFKDIPVLGDILLIPIIATKISASLISISELIRLNNNIKRIYHISLYETLKSSLGFIKTIKKEIKDVE